MRRLWVYKCNARNLSHQRTYGDWADFFAHPGNGEWGGTWGIGNAASRKILLEKMKPGDLILAYQTDRRAALGICKVDRISRRRDGETNMYLERVEVFGNPVDILAMKRTDQAVASVRAFRQGQVQTLYETSDSEAETLLRVCRAKTRLRMEGHAKRRRRPAATGAGFAEYNSNQKVEHAAVRAVQRKYRKCGWNVRSVEAQNLGYDLCCIRSGNEEQHVEVKGIRGGEERFVITAGEVERAESDPHFRLATVTSALGKPRIRIWLGTDFLRLFDRVPLQYAARLRATGTLNSAPPTPNYSSTSHSAPRRRTRR